MLKNIITTVEARAYVRVSTLNDSQKDSPEHQEGLIRESANIEGLTITKVYLDRGTATNIIEREDVQQMINDAKNGDFNTIYFASLSRFSRDTLDAISLKRILVNALGIRVVSIEDMYDSAKEDNEMIFTIISSVNQKQSEVTSTASKRGIRQSAKKGNFTGSIAPFGYKKIVVEGRKTLEVVPEQAEIVKTIFNCYINKGMGEKSVTLHLNETLNIPSPKGGIWGLSSVQRILQNENYTGYLTFGKSESKKVYEDINDMHNRRKKLVAKSSDQWERTDFQTHEAIISKDDYEKAQELREIRGGGKRGGRKAFVNVFAKMAFCKECGAAMVSMGTHRQLKKTEEVKRYRYLMCSKHRRQGDKGCDNSIWMPYEETRDIVISKIIEKLQRLIKYPSLVKNLESDVIIETRDFDKELKQLEKVISDNRMLLFETRKLNMLGELTKEQYEFEKVQYEKTIDEANAKLTSLSKRVKEQKNSEAFVQTLKETVKELSELTSFEDVEFTRSLLLEIIDKIDITSEGRVEVHSVLGKI